MYGRTETSCIIGIDGVRVIVEADYGDGLPQFEMVGFLGSEVREARERVRAAMKNSGIPVAPGRLTVNLSPADLRKQGNSFDLPIAVAVLIALGIVPQRCVEDCVMIGELSLDGGLRGISGALSHVLSARERGIKRCIVPKANVRECTVLSTPEIYGFESLNEVVSFLIAPETYKAETMDRTEPERTAVRQADFSEVLGQESVKRAAAAAAAGSHGLLMIGPPGSGKSMTAKRIPTILPPLTEAERLECSRIHSVAGILDGRRGLIAERPFRSPHHTISASGLIGGGITPRPGEMSLAHNGVLFLDELPEFSKSVLEVMRAPLEDGRAVISRVNGTCVFPTGVMLVCAMNPCRCGYYPDRSKCKCSEAEVHRYLSRISRPLLDRIDIAVEVPRVRIDTQNAHCTSSAELREMVMRAWELQQDRYRGKNIVFNSRLTGSDIRKYCELGTEERQFLKSVFDRTDLSARAHDRILKVARTLADLEGEERIRTKHLAEAVSYRSVDRKFWGE